MSSLKNVAVFLFCFLSSLCFAVCSSRREFPYLSSAHPGKGKCEVIVALASGSSFVNITCKNIQTPEKLQEVLEASAYNIQVISIEDSQLSHLPQLTKDHKVETLVFTSSFLAFFAPPVYKDPAEINNTFFKKTKVKYLKFKSVPYLHALDWSWIGDSVKNIYIEDSRFVYVPQSFGNITSLEKLQVRSSHVKWVNENAFTMNEEITHVDFADNAIERLEPGTFNFPQAEHFILDLRKNRLKDLPEGLIISTLSGVSCDLSTIMLDDNPLEDIKKECFGTACYSQITLRNTNIKCDCNYTWLRDHGVEGECTYTDGRTIDWMKYLVDNCNP